MSWDGKGLVYFARRCASAPRAGIVIQKISMYQTVIHCPGSLHQCMTLLAGNSQLGVHTQPIPSALFEGGRQFTACSSHLPLPLTMDFKGVNNTFTSVFLTQYKFIIKGNMIPYFTLIGCTELCKIILKFIQNCIKIYAQLY